MTSARLVAVLAAVAACGALGAVLGTVVVTGTPSRAPAAAPCLRSGPEPSAQLAGTRVDVSPAPATSTANPATQISFLGAPAGSISAVSVVGARSGKHSGRLVAFSQGDGASFLPDRPFSAGERVTVHALLATSAGERPIAFSFGVDDPYPTAQIAPFPNPAAPHSDYQTFRTLPGARVPVLTVSAPDRDPAAGDVFLTSGPGPGQYGPLIYTPQGRLVWFDPLPSGTVAENLSVQDWEGAPHLTFWQGKVLSLGFGQGEDLVLDSRYRTVARVRGGNGLEADLHDFQLAGNGIAYATAYNPIHCNLASAGGSQDGVLLDTAIQEIDVRTGLVRWEWHSLDHVSVAQSRTEPPKGAAPWDWFHLNSIDVEPGGDLLISARSTWAAYQLEHGSGKVLWQLGGTGSSFRMGPGTQTAWQHDARLLPNGEVTLFDDGSNPPVHRESRGVRIALDLARHEARLSASYSHSPTPLLAASQGNMQTLPDGNVVLEYGAVPQLTEFAPDGAILFDAHLPLDMSAYRGFRFRWSAQPTQRPAVAASLNNTGEETIVRMSWNGATDAVAWRVLAGAQPGALTAQTTVPSSGFETGAILPAKWAYVSVQALGANGRVLEASAPAAVTSYGASLE
jgi:hypothetical protein